VLKNSTTRFNERAEKKVGALSTPAPVPDNSDQQYRAQNATDGKSGQHARSHGDFAEFFAIGAHRTGGCGTDGMGAPGARAPRMKN